MSNGMTLDHWNPRANEHILPHLKRAGREIRISSGYFTVQGYHILKPAFEGKRLFVLVGYDENAANQLREHLIDNIMAHLSLWDEGNRREAVIDLVNRIEAGDFLIAEQRTENILDIRVRRGDHSKVFIVDDALAVVGSANLTKSGLIHNTESVTVVDDLERVQYWLGQFDAQWNAQDTRNLTQDLLEALKRWLELRPPFDVYLKTIQALDPEDKTLAPRPDYKMPVAFQQVIVERALRQLTQLRGAFIVASTGLGKTIIATHIALRLRQQNEILNVLVFAPKPVRKNWKQALSSAGLAHEIFAIELLDQKIRGDGVLKDMADALTRVDEKHLIVIDESHRFRNRIVQATADDLRRSFNRIEHVNKTKNPMVILLTATPYAKGVDDLNNQLTLLPKTAPPNNTLSDGQLVFEAWANDLIDTTVWRIMDTPEFFEDFKRLPVCTVFSTSLVAKNYATRTDEGEYLDFGNDRRWIPQVEISRVTVPVLLEKQVGRILGQGGFKHAMVSIPLRGGGFRRTDASIEKEASIAWASSPLALAETIWKSINGHYSVDFVWPKAQHQEALGELLDAVTAISYEQDMKLQALLVLINELHSKGEKAIVFTERYATAIYLERAIQEHIPTLRVANVVQETAPHHYGLKDDGAVENIVVGFAPESNSELVKNSNHKKSYDILISTDAFSAGVNLQDASAVVNYDLAWTPEIIIQRIGRILRFWSKPRTISCFTFVGNYEEDGELQQTARFTDQRLQKLLRRTENAQKFSEMPVIPKGETTTFRSLGDLTNVSIDDLGVVDLPSIEDWSGVSPFLMHITTYNKHAARARQIPDDIMSALSSTQKNPMLFLLVRHKGDYFWPVYDLQRNQLRSLNEDDLLDLTACESNEPPAIVDPNEIELVAQEVKATWAKAKGFELESVERICALYLQPKGTQPTSGDSFPALAG